MFPLLGLLFSVIVQSSPLYVVTKYMYTIFVTIWPSIPPVGKQMCVRYASLPGCPLTRIAAYFLAPVIVMLPDVSLPLHNVFHPSVSA